MLNENNFLRKFCWMAWKALSNDDVGVARGTVFQKIGPVGAGFKTGNFR